ncbi:MAG: DNA cytosine methyltransferase [Terriglobales bacterium]
MNSVELFVGAGGLALGLAESGFRHAALIERDHQACETLRENQRRGRLGADAWPLFEGDSREFDYGAVRCPVDLLAAGVPCQPFSIGGKHAGDRDERNMFPEVARAVRHLRPRAVLLENVRGLLRRGFARYFSYVQLSVAYPELTAKPNEGWLDHLGRLERYHTSGRRSGLYYRVVFRHLNAADYGVPQRRERVFIVAIRGDLSVEWSFPKPTHGFESLIWSKWISGGYWERHCVPKRLRPQPGPGWGARLKQLSLFPPAREPWRTVRDAISDLPKPSRLRGAEEPALCHFLVPGARRYAGHTGSDLDHPAKTLKAGDHGVPGGENMLAERYGAVRYFTLRECARIQAFPDEFVFPGSWTESMRQIGNAVPVSLARVIGEHLVETLRRADPQANAGTTAAV